MSLTFSTGLRNQLLGRAAASTGNGLAGILHQCFIDVYSGAKPVSADAAPAGTKLGTFTSNDDGVTGLTFDPPADGTLVKKATEVWKMHGLAAGTAGWFRVRLAADSGALSTTDPRIDGTVAKTGADLNLTNTAITLSSPHSLDVFSLAIAAN